LAPPLGHPHVRAMAPALGGRAGRRSGRPDSPTSSVGPGGNRSAAAHRL